MPATTRHAYFDDTLTGVVVERLTLRDKDVAREAQRWTDGERGPIVDDPESLNTGKLNTTR